MMALITSTLPAIHKVRDRLAPWLHPELLAAAAVPLAFNPWGYSAFALPEAVVLRALALLALLLAFVRAGRSRRRLSAQVRGIVAAPLVRPALFFGVALLVASLASVDPRTSIVGSVERQHGLLTVASCLVLFVTVAATLRTRVQIERLWQMLVWASAPVVLYGLAQAAGVGTLGWITDSVSPVLSTLGRSNFVGSYLVLVLPLTAGRLLLARDGRPLSLLLGAQLACLVVTQARGAWIAAAAAAAVAALLSAGSDRRRLIRISGATGLLLAVLLGLVVVLDGLPATGTRQPAMERLVALADIRTGSSAARLTIWRTAVALVAERPWLGYGPETMGPTFSREFPPQLVYYQGRQTIVDRTHMLWLDLMMAGGLIGLGAFLLLLLAAGRLVARGLRAANDRWSRIAWSAATLALVGHLVGLQFAFDVVSTATLFWLILGMLAALARLDEAAGAGQDVAVGADLLPYLPAALVLSGIIWLLCVRPLRADMAYQQARLAETPAERVASAGRAVDHWPVEPLYRLGLARAAQHAGDPTTADTQLDVALRLRPHDPDLYVAWGQILRQRKAYHQAGTAFQQAVAMAPTVARYHMLLGLAQLEQDRPAAGVAALERAVELDGTDYVAYRHLAEAYRRLDRTDDAARAARKAEHWYWKALDSDREE